MGKQYGFYFNIDRCVQCHACQVACKAHNSVELGVKWRKVIGFWAGEYPNLTNRTLSYSCMHCAEPACVSECPAKALTKRSEDGIVVVDLKLCVGCRTCGEVCPFGAPQYGEDGMMQKCSLCVERLSQGKHPACFNTCPGEALHFGTMDELAQLASANNGHQLDGPTKPSMLVSSKKWPVLRSIITWK